MKIKDINRKPKHITSIGGQALIEGLLMRSPKKLAVALRDSSGEIIVTEEELDTASMRHKILRLPLIRGVVGLVESMKIGVSKLMYSVDFLDMEEEESESFMERRLGKEKAESIEMTLTLLSALLISIFFFMLLPNILTSFLKRNISSPIGLNLLEGLIRLIIFGLYLFTVTRIDEVGDVFDRMWQYHGAEHKTIHCYEAGEDLTVENVKKYSILHPRCGTSFLFMVMIVSIFVLSLFGWPSPLKRFLVRIVMLPVIAGISYEINRLIGKSDSSLAYYLSYPGLMIQKYATVKEPDDEQIEVAIVALKGVITSDKEEDRWK